MPEIAKLIAEARASSLQSGRRLVEVLEELTADKELRAVLV